MPGYPTSEYDFRIAYEDLRAASTLIHVHEIDPAELAEARAVIGRQPMCQGWRESVAAVHKTGWFQEPGNKLAAQHCLRCVEAYLKPGQDQKQKAARLAASRAAVMALGKRMKACKGMPDVFRELTV